MADLGNKMNPTLAGLTGLGEGLFQGFLLKRKQQEEERQFSEKMAMEERQNSLLNDFRIKNYELQLAQEQREGVYQNALMKNMDEDNARLQAQSSMLQNKPPKMVESRIESNGKIETYFHPEGEAPSGKPFATSPQWKPEGTKEPSETDKLNQTLKEIQIENQKEKDAQQLEKDFTNIDALITARQNGEQEQETKTAGGDIVKTQVYKVGDKNIDPKLWKSVAENKVNSLIDKMGLKPTVSKLWLGINAAAKKRGIDFDKLPSSDKRKYLKQVLDNNQDIPEQDKKALYQYIEIKTRW